jgi:hypothetical protein
VKRIRGDGPIGVIIHRYVETIQGNSLCSYLFQTSKNVIFLFLSFMVFLLLNQRTGEWNRFCGGMQRWLALVGRERWQGKG